MFTINDSNGVTPAFISKLWEMVNDPKYDDFIQWHNEGSSFIIKDPANFCSELLPIFYKHNNMASFIRQLNKYGFRKVVPIDSASLKGDRTELEFSHQYFLKDHPLLIHQIKRKTANTKEVSYSEVVTRMAKQIQQLQQQQTMFKTKLNQMHLENDALWKEYSVLRYKQQQLQSLIRTLIQFLIEIIHKSRGFNFKRVPTSLMIKDCIQRSDEGSAPILTTPNNDFINSVKTKGNSSNLFSTTGNSSTSGLGELDDSNLHEILQFGGSSGIPSPTRSLTTAPISIQEVNPSIVRGKYSLQNIYPKGKTKSNNFGTNIYLTQNQTTRNQPIQPKIVKQGKTLLCKPNNIIKKPATSRKIPNILSNKNSPTAQIKLQDEIKPNNKITFKEKKKVKTNPQDLQLQEAQIVPEIELLLNSDNIKQNNTSSSLSNNSDGSDGVMICENLEEDPAANTIMDVSTMPIVLSPSGTELTLLNDANDQTEKSNDENNLMAVDFQWDDIKSDLDVLKDILQGDGYGIDTSQLFGLFNNDDPLSLNLPESSQSDNNYFSGNELISYNPPNLMDILDGLEDNEDELKDLKPVLSPSLNTPRPTREFDIDSPSTNKRKKI